MEVSLRTIQAGSSSRRPLNFGFDTSSGGPSSDYRPVRIYVPIHIHAAKRRRGSELELNVLADNVVAVYLNGHKLGQQAMVDCNDGAFGPCH